MRQLLTLTGKHLENESKIEDHNFGKSGAVHLVLAPEQ